MPRTLLLSAFAAALCLACGGREAPPPPPSTTPATQPPSPTPVPSPPAEGQDFAEEARLLYRMVACQGDEALPAAADAATVKAHCATIESLIGRYRKTYVDQAKPFIAHLRPE